MVQSSYLERPAKLKFNANRMRINGFGHRMRLGFILREFVIVRVSHLYIRMTSGWFLMKVMMMSHVAIRKYFRS